MLIVLDARGYGVLHLEDSDDEADLDAPIPDDDVVAVVECFASSLLVSFEHFSFVDVENTSSEAEHVHLVTLFSRLLSDRFGIRRFSFSLEL